MVQFVYSLIMHSFIDLFILFLFKECLSSVTQVTNASNGLPHYVEVEAYYWFKWIKGHKLLHTQPWLFCRSNTYNTIYSFKNFNVFENMWVLGRKKIYWGMIVELRLFILNCILITIYHMIDDVERRQQSSKPAAQASQESQITGKKDCLFESYLLTG